MIYCFIGHYTKKLVLIFFCFQAPSLVPLALTCICISFCFQAMYSEFSTSNIQIDKDFTAKLSGYGCAGFNTEEISNAPVVCSFPSVEV